VTSADPDRLAKAGYEAHRSSHPSPLPPWEEASETDRQAWRAAMSVVGSPGQRTYSEAAPIRSLHIQAGDQRHVFDRDFTAGRDGTLVISDDWASGRHARFQAVRGMWYVEDMGSTNGTWLNGRRIHVPQPLKKGDKIRIGRTVIVVRSA
jgi:pSer/pThr/pTyr-binding forkhead associated (FHA) protein